MLRVDTERRLLPRPKGRDLGAVECIKNPDYLYRVNRDLVEKPRNYDKTQGLASYLRFTVGVYTNFSPSQYRIP